MSYYNKGEIMKHLLFFIAVSVGFASGVNPPQYFPVTYIPMPMQMQQQQSNAPVVINIMNGHVQPQQIIPNAVEHGVQRKVNRAARKNLGARFRNLGMAYTGYAGYKHYKKHNNLKKFLNSKEAKIGIGSVLFAKPISRIPVLKHLLKLK